MEIYFISSLQYYNPNKTVPSSPTDTTRSVLSSTLFKLLLDDLLFVMGAELVTIIIDVWDIQLISNSYVQVLKAYKECVI